jgi:predicted nucleotidyltransferase
MILKKLTKAQVAHPPSWLPDNTHYMTIMGSDAYGVSSDSSDIDVYGFCMPPKDMVFPHLRGEIPGFGTQIKRFEVWQEHHLNQPGTDREYDFSIYSIVKYFQLCMENNPNMVDSLFTPNRCVLHQTPVAVMVRENRKLFLCKKSFHTFKGYSYAQLAKIKAKKNAENPKRAADIAKYGFDLKMAYHVVRLANECHQILEEGDLDLERSREQLKSIRRGDWTFAQIEEYFERYERLLSDIYAKSELPHSPREEEIKDLLLKCLEQHYGSLDQVIKRQLPVDKLLNEISAIVEKYR